MLHETIASTSVPEIGRDCIKRKSIGISDPRDGFGDHLQDEYSLVQRAIVLEVPNHYLRCVALRLRQEYCCTGNARDSVLPDRCQELADRLHRLVNPLGHGL